MRSTTTRIRNVLAAAALCTTAACSSDGATGPDAAALWDLTIDLPSFTAGGNCEVRDDNPGEIAIQVMVRNSRGRGSAVYETQNYPSEAGAYSLHDNESVDQNARLVIRGISDEHRDAFSISLFLTEHDPDGPDPDMNNVQGTVPVPFRTTPSEKLVSVRSGTGHECVGTQYFNPLWTPAGS